MLAIQRQFLPQQVAAHLREGIERGRWSEARPRIENNGGYPQCNDFAVGASSGESENLQELADGLAVRVAARVAHELVRLPKQYRRLNPRTNTWPSLTAGDA